MNAIIKNPQNQSVESILASYTVGWGNTAQLPETYQFTESGSLSIVDLGIFDLSDNIVKAKFLNLLDKELKNMTVAQQEATLQALEADYLGVKHLKSATSDTVKKAIKVVRKVLTAAQYKENCIKMNLDTKNYSTVSDLIDAVASVNDKTSKADLLKICTSFADTFFNSTDKEHYQAIADQEAKDAALTATLTEQGFVDIVRDNRVFRATIALAQAAAVNSLSEHGFTLLDSNANVETLTLDITFELSDSE